MSFKMPEGSWKKGDGMETYRFGAEDIEVLGTWDTVVVGGGTAGASCAISAANGGNRTLVVEAASSLGGSPSQALVTPMMPSYAPHGKNLHEIERRLNEAGIVTREDGGRMGYIWTTAESFACVLEDMLQDAGGEVLYDAPLVRADVKDGKISAIEAMTVEGPKAICAAQFVDATGDAVLSRLAGVPCLAGDDDGNNQMSSLRFEMGGIDVDCYRRYCLSLGDEFSPLVDGYFWESAMVAGRGFKLEPLFQKGVEAGILEPSDLVYYQCFSLPGEPGCMAFNCPHLPDLKKNSSALARSQALREGRQRIRRLVKFLTAYMPGFEDAYLIRIAPMLGVRESWRIQGSYVLDVDDYVKRAKFDDAVANGTWYIDVHSATKGLVHMEKYQKGEYYQIPYRCLTNKTISNMLTVGRCISTSFLVQASVRIQQTVIDMGDSAGRACARAKKQQMPLSELDGTGLLVAE